MSANTAKHPPGQTPCNCPKAIKLLASHLPPRGRFDFSCLTTINPPLHDLWKCIEACKTPVHSNSLITTVVGLSENILSLCHAACNSYQILNANPAISVTTAESSAAGTALDTTINPLSFSSSDDPSSLPSLPSSSWTCSKSPMSLGKLVLQDEEEECLLARQVIYSVLTNLSALLRDTYIRDKEIGGSGGTTTGMNSSMTFDRTPSSALLSLYGREVDEPVSRTLSKVLSLLGKLFPE